MLPSRAGKKGGRSHAASFYPAKVLIVSSGQNKSDPLLSLLAKETTFDLPFYKIEN
jgi:hypothetical protein